MFVPFDEISSNAKIWIYQINRPVTQKEHQVMEEAMMDFCEKWQAHGNSLSASFLIPQRHFLVLAVDENAASASGCSIDGSVRVLKELGATLNIDFFDRTLAAFLVNDKIEIYPISQLKEKFASGTLNSNTITFDNLVPTKGAYDQKWMIPVAQSWLARYLPKSALASE